MISLAYYLQSLVRPRSNSQNLASSNMTHVARKDYKFVYVGPKGSWTPFHSDVFGSYSWSANVVGQKEWLFFPPGQELNLASDGLDGSKHLFDLSALVPEDAPYSEELQTLVHKGREVSFYRILQDSQDVVFVPSGWYHQVTNLRDTISINHNWFNASNCMKIYANMEGEMARVRAEIADCKETASSPQEWEEMCQSLLNASFGMNHRFLAHLSAHVASKRLLSYKGASDAFRAGGPVKIELETVRDLMKLIVKEHPSDTYNSLLQELCDEIMEIL